ncbi:olfactory receptor 1F1-like [Conger conger]|uniref:olfactory receptor 1F1-like n=1 Tax=Conger conger TaxID=82655 RepID=UPI002A59D449|nr:olfactory receptor 1F1-like [Conger conger]
MRQAIKLKAFRVWLARGSPEAAGRSGTVTAAERRVAVVPAVESRGMRKQLEQISKNANASVPLSNGSSPPSNWSCWNSQCPGKSAGTRAKERKSTKYLELVEEAEGKAVKLAVRETGPQGVRQRGVNKPAMSPLNSALLTNDTNDNIVHPDYFFITGLAGIPHANYYYMFLCFVYVLTVLGNTFIMFMIYTEQCLHSPKYIVVFNLALCDLCGSTALVPQMIDTFLFKSNLISFGACLANMFFVIGFLAMQSFSLAVLSYDRCIAICFPLRYNEIVTHKSMLIIIAILWIIDGLAFLIAVIFINRLSFCKSTVIKSYFCEHGPILSLACNDNTPSSVIHWSHPIMMFWLPVLFITGTYICITRALLKIVAASERLKAMKTCTSHLILVSIFYLPAIIAVALGSIIHQNAKILNMSLAVILPPMLNPIIYSLKTEEFTETIKKFYRRKKIHMPVWNK